MRINVKIGLYSGVFFGLLMASFNLLIGEVKSLNGFMVLFLFSGFLFGLLMSIFCRRQDVP